MPRPYPKEFREDVIRVARNRGPDVRVKDVAPDFGISESCLTNSLAQADVEDQSGPDSTHDARQDGLRKKLEDCDNRLAKYRAGRRSKPAPNRLSSDSGSLKSAPNDSPSNEISMSPSRRNRRSSPRPRSKPSSLPWATSSPLSRMPTPPTKPRPTRSWASA